MNDGFCREFDFGSDQWSPWVPMTKSRYLEISSMNSAIPYQWKPLDITKFSVVQNANSWDVL